MSAFRHGFADSRDWPGIMGNHWASHGPPRTALALVKGSFRYWWQVQGSNLGRLSRRFYRPLPLATRATCLVPPHRTAQ